MPNEKSKTYYDKLSKHTISYLAQNQSYNENHLIIKLKTKTPSTHT